MNLIEVPIKTGSWCGDNTVALSFPSHWNIQVHDMADRQSLTESQIAAQFDASVNSHGLDSLLQANQKVAIVIDDHTRPTPVSQILPQLLARIRQRGIPARNVTLIVAVGTHTFPDTSLMAGKLGAEVASEIRIVYPDCQDSNQLRYIGTSSSGVPIFINRHFADADVRIAVSGVYPHDEVSFSGGAKILIGVLGLETLSRIHRKHGLLKRGSLIDTAFRLELEDVADLVSLNYSVNCILNRQKMISAVCCGDFRTAFRAATQYARKDFGTTVNREADVLISNAYPLDTALCVLGKSKWPFAYAKPGAHKVLVTALCNCPAGRIPLATSGNERSVQRFKKLSGLTEAREFCRKSAIRWKYLRDPDSRWQRSHVVYVPHIDPTQRNRPTLIDHCHVEYRWQSIIDDLLRRIGSMVPVKVSLYASAPMLYPVSEE